MIPYYDELIPEEQAEVTEIIRLLYRQTFILERKYDKRTSRYQYNKDFRFCSKHLPFIREYLKISEIEVRESSQMGVIYIQGESQLGEKLPQLATLYILILKLIYDEQMNSASNSIHIITTLGEMNERLGNNLGLLAKNPPHTKIRQAIALLKKYQLIEPLDMMEGMEPQSRMLIYPSINAVLFGEDARRILSAFADAEAMDGTDVSEGASAGFAGAEAAATGATEEAGTEAAADATEKAGAEAAVRDAAAIYLEDEEPEGDLDDEESI